VFVEVGPRNEDGNFPVYNPDHQIVLYVELENTQADFSPPRLYHEDPDDYHPRSPQDQVNNQFSPIGSHTDSIPPQHDPNEFHQNSQDD